MSTDAKTAVTLAMALPLEEGIAALTRWKAEQVLLWWDAFDSGIQAVGAAGIRVAADANGAIEIANLCKAVLAETAGVMGIPEELLPFTKEPHGRSDE